ncbi:MAG: PCC domain-containing protein [Cyanobacteriota bacterium]|jgi:uncharacterized protein
MGVLVAGVNVVGVWWTGLEGMGPRRLSPRQEEQAGCVISAIGSLSGTLSADGAHLHIAAADSSGAVIGRHLCAGSLVHTTAELDPASGYAELTIKAQPER